VWKRIANGRELHFYLAGINNQNFLMRDKETGTWWQQINGRAIYGPMQGASLELIPYDELTFGEWKSEVSGGKVFAPVAKYAKEYDSNWEPEVAKLPVVISFPGTELKSRDVVVGLELDGASRAYPWDMLTKQSPVVDRIHGTPLLVAVAPDGKSFRVFISRIDGKDAEFFLKGEASSSPAAENKTEATTKNEATTKTNSAETTPAQAKPASAPTQTKDAPVSKDSSAATAATKPNSKPNSKPWILLDTATASEWNFQGCAISGPSAGKCLDRVTALKDYWFDWRNYHPATTIYKH
jgi:Protein of unknown function (DUF3179)